MRGAAVNGPVAIDAETEVARRILELVPQFPTRVWGRYAAPDSGDMWNSNSLISWLLVRAGVDVTHTRPPAGGRGPGSVYVGASRSIERDQLAQAGGLIPDRRRG